MATFKFGRTVDIHWNGYDIVGPADTVFSIPDQLYEEFDADISGVEPTLVWIDTNEFQTLQNSVVTSTIVGSSFITTASTTAGTQISIVSGSATNGYVLTANGSGGVSFAAAPGGAGSLSAVIGTSPISVLTSSGTATVSLSANYQTAGTYVSSVIGSAPVSASGTTAITVSIDQTALSVSNADTATTLRTYVKNASGSTINKGEAVYITGADGTNALIGLASATSDAASSKTLGIAASTMTNNAFGYVIENGQLSNIDTSATTAGAAIWLGNTPGSLVFGAPPAEPSHAVYLGVVTKANVSTGEILVKVQNGYELDELHDVFVGGVSTALPLVYSSTSSGWIAQALSSVGIADNAVVEAKINAGAVTSAKIADNAVVSAKILDGAVTSAKIADNAVVAAKINAGAVDTSKISSGVAANGTVLTANGSGAASFNALAIGNVSVSASVFTASGTWTKPANTQYIVVEIVGAGQGGWSGGKNNGGVTRNGGIGGAGGNYGMFTIDAAAVASSVTVTIASGGIGGSASTATASQAPGAVSSTSFGSLVVAQAPITTNRLAAAVNYLWFPNYTHYSYDGSAYSTATNAVGPGTPGTADNTAGVAGGRADLIGGGGGGGGGLDVSNTSRAGGAGGKRYGFAGGIMFDSANTGNTYPTGGGGAGGSSGTPGFAGTDGAADTGSGGGGGGSFGGTSTAGAGGNGATPGGGGGGGAARQAAAGTTSWPGGNGGSGRIRVWAYIGA